jgi:hypothetical protein
MTARGAARSGRRLGLRLIVPVALVALMAPVSVAAAPAGPPKPKVTTLGVTRSATVFTSCWRYGTRKRCVESGSVGHPASRIRWTPGAKVTIDLRLPASDVNITAERVADDSVVAADSVRLAMHRVGSGGRRWLVRLPARADRCTDLIMYARLGDRGEIVADLGLSRG